VAQSALEPFWFLAIDLDDGYRWLYQESFSVSVNFDLYQFLCKLKRVSGSWICATFLAGFYFGSFSDRISQFSAFAASWTGDVFGNIEIRFAVSGPSVAKDSVSQDRLPSLKSGDGQSKDALINFWGFLPRITPLYAS
jgi:hypothetical protein